MLMTLPRRIQQVSANDDVEELEDLTDLFAEEAQFTKAIAANPEDMTARLVYADWLEERANLPVHAYFIRHRVAHPEVVHHLIPGQVLQILHTRSDKSVDPNWHGTWGNEPVSIMTGPPGPRGTTYTVRRGFIENVGVSKEYLRHFLVWTVAKTNPVTRVEVHTAWLTGGPVVPQVACRTRLLAANPDHGVPDRYRAYFTAITQRPLNRDQWELYPSTYPLESLDHVRGVDTEAGKTVETVEKGQTVRAYVDFPTAEAASEALSKGLALWMRSTE